MSTSGRSARGSIARMMLVLLALGCNLLVGCYAGSAKPLVPELPPAGTSVASRRARDVAYLNNLSQANAFIRQLSTQALSIPLPPNRMQRVAGFLRTNHTIIEAPVASTADALRPRVTLAPTPTAFQSSVITYLGTQTGNTAAYTSYYADDMREVHRSLIRQSLDIVSCTSVVCHSTA